MSGAERGRCLGLVGAILCLGVGGPAEAASSWSAAGPEVPAAEPVAESPAEPVTELPAEPTSTPAPTPAAAASSPNSAVVLPISTTGEVSPVALDRIKASLRQALISGQVAVVDATGPTTCSDLPCLKTQAEGAGTKMAIQLNLALEGRDYRFELLAMDRDGKLVSREEECAICGFDEAAQVVKDEATLLAKTLTAEAEPAVLTVDTTPAGATVMLDDKEVGVTPLSFPVSDGEHELRIVKDGYGEKLASYDAVSGVKEKLSFELRALPVPPNPKLRVGGWLTVGIGIAFFGAGVGVLAINDRPVPSRCNDPVNIDPNGLCRYRFTSLPAGAALLGVGSAAVAAGAVWLFFDRKQRKASGAQARRVVPTGLGLAGRF